MDETKHIGLRVPVALLTHIDSLIGQMGDDRTAVMLALLRQSLNRPGSAEERLTTVERLLNDVDYRLANVELVVEQCFELVPQIVERTASHVEHPFDAVPQIVERTASHVEQVVTPGEWLTASELGKRYSIAHKNLKRDAQGDIPGYLKRKTNVNWEMAGDPPRFRIKSE